MSETFKNYLLSKDLSSSTVEHYHTHVMDFLAWLDQQQIEAETAAGKDVSGYLHMLKKRGNGNITRSVQLFAIKHFFDYQVQAEKRIDNPAKYLKIRGTHRQTLYPILSVQELDGIYNNYTVPKADDARSNRNWFTKYRLSRQRNKVVLGLLVNQGLATPEIAKMKLTDLNLREGKIFIAGARKSAARTLELKPYQIMELMEYQYTTRAELQKFCPKQSENLFISAPPAGEQTTEVNNAMYIWKRLSEEVEKIAPRFINMQQLRASVITHWLGKYNLREVQYMAGHKHISSTERYKKNQTEDLQNEIEEFHPIG